MTFVVVVAALTMIVAYRIYDRANRTLQLWLVPSIAAAINLAAYGIDADWRKAMFMVPATFLVMVCGVAVLHYCIEREHG